MRKKQNLIVLTPGVINSWICVLLLTSLLFKHRMYLLVVLAKVTTNQKIHMVLV